MKFLIDDVCSGSCDNDIWEALRNLPKDLEEAFERALSRTMQHGHPVDVVRKAFQWVAVVQRPLSLEELGEALSVRIGQPSSIPGQRVPGIHKLVLWSANLLQIAELEPRYVQFAHASIRDYITKSTLPEPLARFHVDLNDADRFAGEICVTYLHLIGRAHV